MIKRRPTPLLMIAILMVSVAIFAQPLLAQNASERRLHTVSWGDTLFSISQQYGVSVDELMRLNDLVSPSIYAGQTLVIVGGTAAPVTASGESGTYVVVHGDTLFSIAQRFNTSVNALVTANGLISPSHITVGQRLSIPGSAATSPLTGYTPSQSSDVHIVKAGETIYSISRQYGVSPYVVTQSNNISNPSLLYVGQQIVIPAGDALNVAPSSQPTSAPVVTSAKSIIVDVSDQRTYTYESNQLNDVYIVSTGVAGLDTWRGDFQIQNKIPNAYASTWNLQMPYWLGFYWAGPLQNGFHALPILSSGLRLWEGLLGQPASYGCVILSPQDAEALYYWAEVGISVTVRD